MEDYSENDQGKISDIMHKKPGQLEKHYQVFHNVSYQSIHYVDERIPIILC